MQGYRHTKEHHQPMENRKTNLKADKLKKLADYFGVSIDYLMTGEGSEKESTSGKKYYFSDETAEMEQKLFENKDLRLLFDASR